MLEMNSVPAVDDIATALPRPDPFAVLRHASFEAIGYRNTVDRLPLRPERGYREMVERFDHDLPHQGSPASSVIDELVDTAKPGLNGMVGSRFYGWVTGGSHPVAVAADWLTSAWGQVCGNHHATPAAAAVEEVAARWILEILDLPRESSVGFVTGATAANFVALAAARHALLARQGWDVEANGLFGAPPLHILVGSDAHSSVFAALRFLGLGAERVIRLPTDAAGRIMASSVEKALGQCDGPSIVIAQAGQINTGAFDPFPELAIATRRNGAWLHVDGAFGLWVRSSAEQAHLAEGIDRADSWATDGHKWLQLPCDCGYAIVRDADSHRRAMSLTASYLPTTSDDERNPSDYVPELSRRARGFATWAMIRHLGRAGIANMVAQHCRAARRMAARLSKEPGIDILNEVDLNQIIIRFGAVYGAEESDRLTCSVIQDLQNEGTCFVGGASWQGHQVMRISCIAWSMTDQDADRSIEAMVQAWRRASARIGA